MEVDGDKVGMGEREALLQKAKLAEQVGKSGSRLSQRHFWDSKSENEIPNFLI